MNDAWCVRHDAVKTTAGCAWCLKAENERLRAERDDAIEMLKSCVHKARIEAALAKAQRIIESLEPDDIEIDHLESVVEALKGGKGE